MGINSSSSTNSSDAANRATGRGSRFAIAIAILYAVLLGGLCWGGTARHVLYVGLRSAGFLGVYAAGPLAVVLWGAFMARRLLARRNKGSVVRAGLKSAWIIFGTIGLVLWIVAAIPPNSRAFCAGYWIHARVWVDVDEIRTWAAERSPSTDKYEPIDAEQWPESLRRVSVSGGVVTCDPKTLTVIFYEGGQYGHWGLTVAPPGSTPSDSVYTVRLEDGAWVWCE